MNIYIPYPLYIALPWLCIFIATISIPISSSLIKWMCILLLYGYAFYVVIMRGQYKNFND